mmetsp:Transcript_18905/g.21098  ORF Transcript_18905/g.21098 Transcript_18905/m.21098 type:complete len:319 (+) Transcript_18905:58-1014(+)
MLRRDYYCSYRNIFLFLCLITTTIAHASSSFGDCSNRMMIKPFRGGSSRMLSYPQQQQPPPAAMMTTKTTAQQEQQSLLPTNTNLMTKVATTIVQYYNNIKKINNEDSNIIWTGEDKFAYLGVVFGVIISLGAMLFDSGLLIDLVAISCIGFSISTLKLQRKLTSEYEYERKLNTIANEEEIMLLAIKNAKSSSQQAIEKKIKQLQSTEKEILMSNPTNTNINNLVCKVEEYKESEQSLKESIKDHIRQILASVITSNHYWIIGPTEIELLCLRFKSLSLLQYFDETAFRSAMKKNGNSIMEFAKEYFANSNDKIFVY